MCTSRDWALAFWLYAPYKGPSFFFLFGLSGIVLVTGGSSEDCGKGLCVRPRAVPPLSQSPPASPWKLQFLSKTLAHTQPGGDRGN